MAGFIQEATDFGKSIAQKANPIIDWVAVKISTFIDVSSENVHLFILAGISLYLADLITGRERFGIKFWGVGIGIFLLLKYLGF